MDACDGKNNPALTNSSRSLKHKMDRTQTQAVLGVDYRAYDYPFENLVFEGGGAKGAAYIGCLKVLDEVGIKPKRVAGTSAGAIIATMIAAGYTSAEIEDIMKIDLAALLLDNAYGWLSYIPKLFRGFGLNSAEKFTEFIGEKLAAKLGKKELTFKELYDKRNIELCIVATRLNMATVQYFHPKTTPNFQIRKALRMSVSIPGLFEPVVEENSKGVKDYYIDGGVLCNYPVHVFDGWWLSMKNDDAFLKRLQPLSQLHMFRDKEARFNEYNSKTLGFVVYSKSEIDFMRDELETRAGIQMSDRPKDSKLYKSKAASADICNESKKRSKEFLQCADRLMNALRQVSQNTTNSPYDVVTIDEVKDLLDLAKKNSDEIGGSSSANESPEQNVLMQTDIDALFGKDATAEAVFQKMDANKGGEITYDEILRFLIDCGLDVGAKMLGYSRKGIEGIRDYALAIEHCLSMNTQKIFLQARDIDRTVGVNTDYIETKDFNLEPSDRDFLVKQGKISTIAFLKQYALGHNLGKKSS